MVVTMVVAMAVKMEVVVRVWVVLGAAQVGVVGLVQATTVVVVEAEAAVKALPREDCKCKRPSSLGMPNQTRHQSNSC